MKKNIYLLSLAVVGLFGHSNAQCGFQSLGPNDTNQVAFGIAEYNALATDQKSGATYVAFYDENYWGAAVREYVGGQWQQVGTNVVCPGKSIWEAMTVDKHGTPYMACTNYKISTHPSVFMWTGTAWDTLDQAAFTGSAQYISLATDKNAVPYIAYEDLGKIDKLVVSSYNSGTSTWSYVGDTNGISGGQAQWVSLAIDTINNIPYVAYEDRTHGDKLMVLSFNGTTWSVVGGTADTAGVSADTATNISMQVDKNGHPYVAFTDQSTTPAGGLTVMTFNGTTWSAVGTASGATSGPVASNSLGVDSADNVYVAYVDNSSYGYGGLSVVQWNGASWNYVGNSYKVSQDFSAKGAKYVSLAMNHGGVPSVIYEDGGVGDHDEMFQWNSTAKTWLLQRGLGFSATPGTNNGVANYISIAVDPSNTVYAAYSDGNNSNKANVMSYSAGVWSQVGKKGLSSGLAKFNNIGFDSKGEPIDLFTDDYGTPNKYGVSGYIYTGGAWAAIGTNSNTLSGGNCYDLAMAISSSDTIYAAFENLGYQPAVMKCAANTAGTWAYVGPYDTVRSDSASGESIAIDKNGNIYLAFTENATYTNGISVMEYTKGKWQYVGPRNFTAAGEAIYASIQIDPNDNMPVVAYTQYAGSFNAHCMKFDGTNWNFVGSSAGFSEDWTDEMNLVIDKTGDYFVAYQDWGNEQVNLGMRNITTEEFDPKVDTAWRVLPTATSTSLSGSSYQSLALDQSGNVYVGYTEFSGYVKKLGCPTGINEINGSNVASASVYPDPNNGSFTIAMQNVTAKSHVFVYNILGENVYAGTLNSDKTQINLNNPAPGIYLYRILTEEGSVISTGKVVIK